MAPDEATPLVSMDNGLATDGTAVSKSSKMAEKLLLSVQVVFLLFFCFGAKYSDSDYDVKEYIAFRDIMAMLLLGFGYLMTFLKSYGLGAVGLTMFLTVLSMQANIPIELALRSLYGDDSDDTAWPLPIGMPTLIDAQFSAATLLITFGALIGRVSPLQMAVVALLEAFFYAFNKVFLVLGYIDAEDVGGSMTIHMFGAIFGLSISYALGPPTSVAAAEPDKVSDILALIGTTILWVFWPSFVGATETGTPLNEMRCVGNTVLALLASTLVSFYLSAKLTHGKLDPVHIANSTLAGGVAIGSSGRLNIGPGGAIVMGIAAGSASVLGYVYSTPFLERKFGIFDTCGVGNLHGWPSIVGGLLSIIYVTLDPEADFLAYGTTEQMLRQLLGVITTLFVASGSGFATGIFIKGLPGSDTGGGDYLDERWWHGEYFDAKEE
jgi:ammonium transporter Rh